MRDTLRYFVLMLLSLAVKAQLCEDVAQYGRCSTNSACGCFHMMNTDHVGVCGFLWPTCSQLTACSSLDQTCEQSDTICIRHPRCQDRPLCYPVSMLDRRICPSIEGIVSNVTTTISTTTRPLIHDESKWMQNGTTIAGGNGRGDQLNQLAHPNAIFVDDEQQSVYIADNANNRIVEWKYNATMGQVVTGGNGTENRTEPLDSLLDAVFDKDNDSFIICDSRNRRVLRWPRQNSRTGQVIIANISCFTLAMDSHGEIYVYNDMKNEVRWWKEGHANGTLVAGGNGIGNRLNQLDCPSSMFVDGDFSLYISDGCNHRVVKWTRGAREGTVVAGGRGSGSSLSQLSYPRGVTADRWGNIYVVDAKNHRVLRWLRGASEGRVILGGNGEGQAANQLYYPTRLSFDGQGNIYVVDQMSNRVQKFNLDVHL